MRQVNITKLKEASKWLRYFSLRMSTKAGSGHPTSALSSADLMATLFVTTFRFDFDNPDNPNNDRLIFSKGHATPLFYSLFALAGAIKKEELDNYRKFTSNLEGHPTPRFPYTEAATGSLGQGLSIGVGMALAMKLGQMDGDKRDKGDKREGRRPLVFVLLGDGEMAEGSVWEAIELASHYRLDNLIGILDVNRLGQSEQTMLGYEVTTYKRRIEAFGWNTCVINGHDFKSIINAYRQISKFKDRPYMVIAKTVKGKGVSFLEDKNGWHGKPLLEEDLDKAVGELGEVDFNIRVQVSKPAKAQRQTQSLKVKTTSDVVKTKSKNLKLTYHIGDQVATRKAYGEALARIGYLYPDVVSLDGDVKNSTYSEIFKAVFPNRFFEMYIAEQNMVGAAVGLSRMGKIPFVSTFSAFFTRAFDQIRLSAISQANIKFCGSHAGVSIGQDGPSQMGLEDMAMFRAVHGCKVLYPADAVATDRLVEEMAKLKRMAYIRTTRPAAAVIYPAEEQFPIGGCKVHRVKGSKGEKRERGKKGEKGERAVIVGAGITLYEALKAQVELAKDGVRVVVIDCYSIKPIDEATIRRWAERTGMVITVEDHYFDGGLGDAVLNVFANNPKVKVHKLAVGKMPRSGKPEELLAWEGIDKETIVKTVKRHIL